MKKSIKKLLITLMLTLGMFGSTLTTFAINDATSNYLKEKLPQTEDEAWSDHGLKSYVTTTPNDNTIVATFDSGLTYYLTDAASESDLDAYVANRLSNSKATEKVSDIADNLDIGADTETASMLLRGFIPVISLVLGFMVILITTGMTIFSAFDLIYIAFPPFRNSCEEAKQTASANGKGNAMAKNSGGQTKLRFVSDDAVFAVTSTETAQTGKNPFIVYFGSRLISYIVLAILLFILLTGNITIFTDIAIKAVSGVLELIQSI